MRPGFYFYIILICTIFSCRSPKNASINQVTADNKPVTGNLNNKFKGEIDTKESITKGACRIKGVVLKSKLQASKGVILKVTSFLGEGATFNTYRPVAGDSIKVVGLINKNLDYGDTLKLEIKTSPIIRTQEVQKVKLIKTLD